MGMRSGKRTTLIWLAVCIQPLLLSDAWAVWGRSDTETARQINPQKIAQGDELPNLRGRDPGLAASATPPANLNITQAVQRAVQWYPDIGTQAGKLMSTAEKIDVARAKYYPQISAGLNNGVTNSYSNHGNVPSVVLSVSQMLDDFGLTDSAVREANAAVAGQQAIVLLSIDKVAHDTAAALVQVQGYQELVAIAEEQLSSLQQIGKLANERNSEGASSLSDVVQTDARIEGARATLAQYQANLERWRATLSTYLGWNNIARVSNEFPQNLGKSCSVASVDDQLVPSVLAARAQVNQAAAQLAGAEAQMKPTISVESDVTHYLNDRYANSEQLDRTQYSAYVRVKMPIYQGGGLTANRDAAQYSLDAATTAVRSAQLEVRQQLSAAQNASVSLEQALQIQARQQLLTQKTRELYQQQYLDLGSRPFLDVLNAEQEVYQARFTQQETQSQLRTLQLDCLYNTGRTRQQFALNNQSIQGVEIQP
ncbi:TolC family outer membrane protein [Kluyvera cryocrescens]|uniref:TolC family outer membrane protein n=1 Tax=Kluyvera cryocrescens TaxID=580 RepID=UPI002DBA6467|nr:TolC family outer membrane protein [Kluyvera cryocrescens]MEB7555625.1 TolC family outer membrane protein [Kluyvera cryocrescens]